MTSYLRRNLNLTIESGVHSSLHPKCHHEACYVKFNLEIKYPLPSIREVCHYKDATTEPIRQPINGFNWQRALPNTASTSVNEKLDILNITILNICNNSFQMKYKFVMTEIRRNSTTKKNNKRWNQKKKKKATFKNHCSNSSKSDFRNSLKGLQFCSSSSTLLGEISRREILAIFANFW